VNATKWSDVVAGKHKQLSYTRQVNTHPLPVIRNRYELPCKSDGCETLVNKRVFGN
jgi:hypothetical protein